MEAKSSLRILKWPYLEGQIPGKRQPTRHNEEVATGRKEYYQPPREPEIKGQPCERILILRYIVLKQSLGLPSDQISGTKFSD
jgi:hypothetical protein